MTTEKPTLILPEEIVGEEIILRQHSMEEAERQFLEVDADRERLRKFLPWVDFVKTVEDERVFINRCLKERERGEGYGYAITRASDGEYIGNIGVHSIYKPGKRCELGYWVLGRFEGQGLMKLAVKQLTEASFKAGYHRVEIRCDPINERSAGVPKSLKFLEEARLRDAICQSDGSFRDALVFAKLATDPKM